MSRVPALAAALAMSLVMTGSPPAAARAAGPPPAVSEDTVHQVAAALRCVVCQNLSVADSPSEMANQMRGIIRARLAGGETPDQVVQYFVGKYGEWILLAPRRQGFNLLVWGAPLVAVLAGLGIVAALLRRWTPPRAPRTEPDLDPSLRERVRREIASRS